MAIREGRDQMNKYENNYDNKGGRERSNEQVLTIGREGRDQMNEYDNRGEKGGSNE